MVSKCHLAPKKLLLVITPVESAALKMIEFPLRLGVCPERINVANDMHIFRMDDATRLRLLHISEATYDEEGRLKTVKHTEDCILAGPIAEDINTRVSFAASNYVLVAPSRDRAADFNFVLKLIDKSCSALYIGYEASGGTEVFSNPAYYQGNALDLSEHRISRLSNLVAKKASLYADNRLSLMADMYLYALSPYVRIESRFIEMSIVLEMLLLPNSKSELTYRFSLRMAKLCQKHLNYNPISTFACAKRIYSTRSKLVHTGKDAQLDKSMPELEDVTRKLLSTYLLHPADFSGEALDSLTLGN